ncbi:Serine/threonine-protein phosphatase BSL1 [Glycine soja]|nr:Serine/threonine-protein phosphatase BSL1 [Glycine soja]
MGSKPWLYPAPTYRTIETVWDTDEDAPGPRCLAVATPPPPLPPPRLKAPA